MKILFFVCSPTRTDCVRLRLMEVIDPSAKTLQFRLTSREKILAHKLLAGG